MGAAQQGVGQKLYSPLLALENTTFWPLVHGYLRLWGYDVTTAITLKNADVNQALETYISFQKRRGIDVVVASQVRFAGGYISTDYAGNEEQVVHHLEKVLMESAGVIVTPIDARCVSVTWNDALLRHRMHLTGKATAKDVAQPVGGANSHPPTP
jgi:hypothetical protein